MVMVILAWVASYYIRFSGMIAAPKGTPEPLLYFKLIPFICVIWLAVFSLAGFYRRTGRHRSAFIEALDVLQSSFLATLAFIAFTYVYNEYLYSRYMMFFFALLHPWFIITGRSCVRKALRIYRRKTPPKRVLIIGGGDSLRHAIEMSHVGDLSSGEICGVMLVGDDAQIEQARLLCDERAVKVLPVPEAAADWPSFFTKNPTASVVLALPHKKYDFLDMHLEKIADQIPDIKLVPDLVRYTRFAAGVDVIDGIPVVSINESPLAGMGHVVKRTVDILGACVALILFGPIMLLLTILVPLTSRGPILFRQERMGLDGRTFHMLKFRSMPVEAESKTGAVWASKGDNRATPLGRFIRKTSLDELPQFFNVLKGDMSLVGPRPERPVFVDQFRQSVPGYYLRHKAKAGVTGWAQVNGWRGNTSIEKRIECDLYYIQNWSVWFDLRIIFLTVFRGFLNKNAY
jgi:Undecaprenyl-phosphate glucose phosphotransferase